MEREQFVIASTELGTIAVSMDAVAQIVGQAAAESYGVVALAGRSRFSRLLPWGIKKGVDVEQGEGLAIELRIVVEHGLRLAEVAATVRWSRVSYELDRMVGIPVAALEVHIDGVRSS